jgi:hypothetical protein
MKNLLTWRKDQNVIHEGKLTHYIPDDNIYVYFRHNATKTVMIILNGNAVEKMINTSRFSKNTEPFKKAKDVISKRVYSDIQSINIPPYSSLILELY